MNCPECGEQGHRYGKTRTGQQRYRCVPCNRTFSDPKPLARLSTSPKEAAFALQLLLEGTSVRATSRLTGLDKNTILRLMVQAGRQCFQFLADTMQNLTVAEIQVDEVWSFVAKKERTAFFQSSYEGVGDAYCYTALDRETKLLFCFHVGRRDAGNATLFADKLALCVSDQHRPHVSTDGFRPYHVAIPAAFNHAVDHGMLIKQYGSPSKSEQRRYSPANIIGAKEYQNAGHSEPGQICTSHIERSNLTVRMQNRRFTRLTNAFSKKWENHELMFALFVAWYNFCRPHMTLGTTPAVAAGLATGKWAIEQLLRVSAQSNVVV
jgi:transposase-like protein/IS1 family transposase